MKMAVMMLKEKKRRGGEKVIIKYVFQGHSDHLLEGNYPSSYASSLRAWRSCAIGCVLCAENIVSRRMFSWVLFAHLDTFDTFYRELLSCLKCLFVVAAKRFISF